MRKQFLFRSGTLGLYQPSMGVGNRCRGVLVVAEGRIVDLVPIRAERHGGKTRRGVCVGQTHIQVPLRDLIRLLRIADDRDLWPLEHSYISGDEVFYWNSVDRYHCVGVCVGVTAHSELITIRAIGRRRWSQTFIATPWDDFDPFLDCLRQLCIRYTGLQQSPDPLGDLYESVKADIPKLGPSGVIYAY